MKRKTHLHTNFVKFIVEKYKKEFQSLPAEDTKDSKKDSKKELSDEFDEIVNDEDIQYEDTEDAQDDDSEDIDSLIKEYLTLEKKYKSKRNGSLFKRK